MLATLAVLAQASENTTDTILWIIAAIFVIGGIVTLVRGAVLYGIVLIVIGRTAWGTRRAEFKRAWQQQHVRRGHRGEGARDRGQTAEMDVDARQRFRRADGLKGHRFFSFMTNE